MSEKYASWDFHQIRNQRITNALYRILIQHKDEKHSHALVGNEEQVRYLLANYLGEFPNTQLDEIEIVQVLDKEKFISAKGNSFTTCEFPTWEGYREDC